MTLTPSLLSPQTPAPSRTASFSESRTDEVAPAKKAKPAMPQGNSQRGFRTLCSFLRPRWASRGGRKQFGLRCGCGTWDGNGTQRCGGRSLLCERGHSSPQLSSLPPPTGCVIWAGGLQRRRSYRSTRSGEGPAGPPHEQMAGAQSPKPRTAEDSCARLHHPGSHLPGSAPQGHTSSALPSGLPARLSLL